ncbi:MAG: c-type cytochrome [Luteimonas sp.]
MKRSQRCLSALALPALALAAAAATAAGVGVGARGTGADGVAPRAPTAPFLDLRRQTPIAGDAEAGRALSAVCSACHGQAGTGIAPNFPNLSGQSATDLYVQLVAFKGGQRNDPVMAPMVAPLDDAGMRNLAAYYASLPPAAGAADPHSSGGRIFADGDPARGIPPCEGCHGRDGAGPRADPLAGGIAPRPPWATIPRLQGQSGAYVAKALQDFRSGARAGSSNAKVMHGVANALGDDDIRALADFLGAK